MKNKGIQIALLFLTLFSLSSCEEFRKVPVEQLEGTWRLEGRPMFEGIEITINRDRDQLKGKITQLNSNKYVRFFCELNTLWITSIERRSNYEFYISERKIGSDLFSIYGLETTTTYKAFFEDENTLVLTGRDSGSKKSRILYKRVITP